MQFAMAIRANHIALGYFSEESLQGPPPTDGIPKANFLVSRSVMKIESGWVVFATGARMFGFVFLDG